MMILVLEDEEEFEDEEDEVEEPPKRHKRHKMFLTSRCQNTGNYAAHLQIFLAVLGCG